MDLDFLRREPSAGFPSATKPMREAAEPHLEVVETTSTSRMFPRASTVSFVATISRTVLPRSTIPEFEFARFTGRVLSVHRDRIVTARNAISRSPNKLRLMPPRGRRTFCQKADSKFPTTDGAFSRPSRFWRKYFFLQFSFC